MIFSFNLIKKKIKSIYELFIAIWNIIVQYPFWSIRFVVGTLISSLSQVLIIASIYPIINYILKEEKSNTFTNFYYQCMKYFDIELNLVNYLLIFIVIALLSSTIYIIVEFDKGRLLMTLENQIRLPLVRKFIDSKWEKSHNIDHGHFVNLTTRDSKLYISVIRNLFSVFSLIIQVLFYMFCVFRINFEYGIFSFTLLTFSSLIFLPLAKLSRIYGRQLMTTFHETTSRLINVARGLKNIKTSSNEKYVFNYLKPSLKKLTSINLKTYVVLPSLHLQTHKIITYFCFAIMLYFSLKSLNMELTDLSIATLFLYKSLQPFGLINDYFSRAMTHIPSLQKIIETEKYLLPETDRTIEITHPISNIEIKDMKFLYNEKTLIADDISVIFKKGEFWAITGPTGVGKTTILDLIIGILKPTTGYILYDGNNSCYTKLNSLHKRIGYLTQNIFIFSGTIEENIIWGHNHTHKEKLDKAIQLSQLSDLIKNKGLDFQISESGQNLSGGQKQRIAIARTFLKDYDFILMDEPSSALDPGTEKDFMKALYTLKGEVGIIMVTHRDEYLKYADHILCIEDGKAEIIK